ncbi:glycosyltransferase family 2 protein, partial [Alienimonas chondri]|uniref:glycosyltransferase family 2 protein n=1 Tax=Alienimonas chondri TaxID=2681879 RepID=UPI0019D57219
MGVFNATHTLREAVDSILKQTLTDYELVVVDDGSTDATPDLLAVYADIDPRVRVIQQENAGLTAALIRGCQEARGRFIARQDADDVSAPERLGKQVDRLKDDRNLVAVASTVEKIGPGGEPFQTFTGAADSAGATRGVVDGSGVNPVHGSVMFHREAYEAVGGYRRAFYCAQDCDLWLRMLADEPGRRLAFLPETLYFWRWSAENVSTTLMAAQAEFGRLAQASLEARNAGRGDRAELAAAAALAAQLPELRRRAATPQLWQ